LSQDDDDDDAEDDEIMAATANDPKAIVLPKCDAAIGPPQAAAAELIDKSTAKTENAAVESGGDAAAEPDEPVLQIVSFLATLIARHGS